MISKQMMDQMVVEWTALGDCQTKHLLGFIRVSFVGFYWDHLQIKEH